MSSHLFHFPNLIYLGEVMRHISKFTLYFIRLWPFLSLLYDILRQQPFQTYSIRNFQFFLSHIHTYFHIRLGKTKKIEQHSPPLVLLLVIRHLISKIVLVVAANVEQPPRLVALALWSSFSQLHYEDFRMWPPNLVR